MVKIIRMKPNVKIDPVTVSTYDAMAFWSCPDGEDEEYCIEQLCASHSLTCVSPYNDTVTCLPAEQVEDGYIECLGVADERQHCKRSLGRCIPGFGFRCSNDDNHLDVSLLCNRFFKENQILVVYFNINMLLSIKIFNDH